PGRALRHRSSRRPRSGRGRAAPAPPRRAGAACGGGGSPAARGAGARMTSAPVDERDVEQPRDADDEEMPRVVITRERALGFGVFVAASIAFLYFVLPKISGGTSESIHNLGDGKPGWLIMGLVFECLSFGGYVILFRTVFVRGRTRIGWRASYEITMAGVAATRLFAAAGAGGIALTAWALRRSGMEARVVACRMVAFLAL